jgi:hypothetical protein
MMEKRRRIDVVPCPAGLVCNVAFFSRSFAHLRVSTSLLFPSSVLVCSPFPRVWCQTLFLAWLNSLWKKRLAIFHARNNVRPHAFPFPPSEFRARMFPVPQSLVSDLVSCMAQFSLEEETCCLPRKKQRQTPRFPFSAFRVPCSYVPHSPFFTPPLPHLKMYTK